MKKVILLPLLALILFMTMSAMRSPTATVTLSIANGTAFYGYCTISGNQINLNPQSSAYTQLAPSTYNITLHTNAPGSHQFFVPGRPAVMSSTGTVSFTAVSITANSNAGIY